MNGSNGYRAYFLYDGGHLVAEIKHDGTLRNLFGWSTAGLLERYQASNSISYVYTYDPSGNVVMRHDSSPSADCDYTTLYDAFGAQHGCLDPLTQTQSQQAKQDRVGYGGQWGYYTDQETAPDPAMLHPGVRYLWVRCGLRDYDSQACRWLQRDPIGYDGGLNVYSFCQNNPVTHADPSGRDDSSGSIFSGPGMSRHQWFKGHRYHYATGHGQLNTPYFPSRKFVYQPGDFFDEAGFLTGWLAGVGPNRNYYGPNDPHTQQMIHSKGGKAIYA